MEHKLVSEIWIDPTFKPYTLYSCNELCCCLIDWPVVIPCISVILFTGVCCWPCQSPGWLPVLSSSYTFAPLRLLPHKFLAAPVTLFVTFSTKYLNACVCCVTLKAMKMSRRSADASQRALAYSRMVDGLNDFRLGNNSHWLTKT